jgi:hypothetical protein
VHETDFSRVETYDFEQETPWGIAENSIQHGWVHRMSICSVCKRASFDRVFTHDGEPEEMEVLYPEPILVPDGLPTTVAAEYGAALKERRRNPNGYAALLGRVLDAICTDKRIGSHRPNGSPIFLGKRLSMLVTQENLSAVEGATGLRNITSHADLGALLPEDVPYLDALIRYILDHLYVIPAVNLKAIDTQQARRPVMTP